MSTAAYRPDIDGLRAISVVMVLILHAVPDLLPGGFIGVDVFFVISGYLISSILQRELLAREFSLWLFFARRVRRILPAMVVVTLATWALYRRFATPDDFVALGKHMMAAAGFVSNYVLWQEVGYFEESAANKSLVHFWSLGVEEQFYLVWPLVMWLSYRFAKVRGLMVSALVLSLISFALYAFSPFGESFSFYSYPTRAWELGLGAMLAFAPPVAARFRGWLSVLGLALMISGLVLHTRGLATLLPTTAAAALIWAGPQAPINRVLALRPMVWVGLHSYPLYLWHWPLLALAHSIGSTLSTAAALWCVAFAIVLSIATRAFIEQPILRRVTLSFSRPRASRLTVGIGLLALAFVATIGALTQREFFFDERLNTLRGLLGHTQATWVGYRNGHCFVGLDDRKFPEECRTPEAAQGPRVLVWGDSYAASMAPAMAAAVDSLGGSFVSYTAPSCPPVLDITILTRAPCTDINNVVFEQIRQDHFTTVVLISNWLQAYFHNAENPSLQAIDSTIARLHQAGVTNIIVVGQFPVWKMPLTRLVMVELARTQVMPEVTTRWVAPGIFELNETMAHRYEREGEHYVGPLDASCPGQQCTLRIEDELWTFDNGHPTRKATELYVKQITPLLK